METTRKINLLETTLRDGSYAVNFSFTSGDTFRICQVLEDLGFEYIEVGHGVGLNASDAGYGVARETDSTYMHAAKSALKKAKYGMFCIPGIARLDDVLLAGDQGMNFIRVGTNATEVKNSEAFIKMAKEKGMFVAANYMKSYVLSPSEFAENVLYSESYGADMIYLVDSSGGMFPYDIKKYFEAIRKHTEIPLGFHGHDNLGLAISNSLFAAELGFSFVDCSLQGLGRSSGNACTEVLVAALLKQGYDLKMDLLKLLEAGVEHIQPMLPAKKIMPLDVIAGFADFHSSYMPKIHRVSSKFNVDPARLIIEICKVDKVNCSESALQEIARSIPQKEVPVGRHRFGSYLGGEQDGKQRDK